VVNIVEYENPQTETPDGFDDTFLCVPSETGLIGSTYVDGVILNPEYVSSITAENNKQIAVAILANTDWTTLQDVSDPLKSDPCLTNAEEFLAFRNRIRAIAINPVAGDLDWEDIPQAVWTD
tara:strand:- start:1885 stop:2250 length:366 start_codon:yes stop_codon:yes gene_type:complete